MESGAVAYVRQQERRGLGHAVWCARRLIGDEPFAVILPDDVIEAETPCLQQMVEAYAEIGGNMVATMEVAPESVRPTASSMSSRGRLADAGAGMVEKPKREVAPSNMAVIGRYILSPQVLRNLEDVEAGAGGEIQLTDAIATEIAAGGDVSALPLQGPPLRLRLEARLPAGHRRLRDGPARPARRVPRLPRAVIEAEPRPRAGCAGATGAGAPGAPWPSPRALPSVRIA